MASATKLPSGSWRVRVFEGRDENGKQRFKSFTAETKRDAEKKAIEYQASKKVDIENLTVHQAIRKYIDVKEGVLSPATVRAYNSMYRTAYDSIGKIKIGKLHKVELQAWVSEYNEDHSAKRVSNAWGLLRASLAMFDVKFDGITLPTKYRFESYVPSDGDVAEFLKYVKQTRKQDNDLYVAVMLAAYGCMRRSEICALTEEDIDRQNNTIRVNKAMMRTEDRRWIIKPPKTPGSVRKVAMPQSVMDAIPVVKEGRILKANPDQISHRFERAILSSGLRRFRFHDLRHYAASALHAAGVPSQYIQKRGGWSSDYVMKRVYIDTISEEEQRINREIEQKINGILSE